VRSSLIFFLLLLFVNTGEAQASSESVDYSKWDFKVERVAGEVIENVFRIPSWSDSRNQTREHFEFLQGKLQRVRIYATPSSSTARPRWIPFLFELKIYRGKEIWRQLKFISHLELTQGSYSNSFLLLPVGWDFEIHPLPLSRLLNTIPTQNDEFSAASESKAAGDVTLGFTTVDDLYETVSEYTNCQAGESGSFFSTYSFALSTLSRNFADRCKETGGVYLVDQYDWIYYKSLVYHFDKNQTEYFIVLKNNMEILKRGRNPNHVKIFSPSKDVAMVTSSSVTLNSLSSDDWIVRVSGETAVGQLRRIFLEDLLFGRFALKEIAPGIEVFSSETSFQSGFDDSWNTRVRSAPKEIDSLILADLTTAKKFITFYNPSLVNVGNRNYNYSRLIELLKERVDAGVVVTAIDSTESLVHDRRFETLFQTGRFRSISPFYSHAPRRSLRPVHARLINIDAEKCYLFTGQMGNTFTNELGFRITNSSYCIEIHQHLKRLYGSSEFEDIGRLVIDGMLKMFRIRKKFSSPQAFDYLVNGKLQKSIALEEFQ
jgi:hypothetical protein